MLAIAKQDADKRGFPTRPIAGTLHVHCGAVWQFFESSGALGDLGFWGALVSFGVSAISSLFGGGKSKEQLKQAEELVKAQDAKIKQLEEQLAKKSEGLNLTKFFKKNPLVTAGFLILILTVVSKK